MKSLSNAERLEAVVVGEQPDRIPVHDLACITMAQAMGYVWKDLRFEPEKCAKVTNEYNKLSGSDFCLGMVEPASMFMDLGMDISMPDDGYCDVINPYFKKPEDVDKLELYDPSNPKESKWLRKGIIDKLFEYRKVNDTGALNGGWCWGPITVAGYLMGTEKLMMYFMSEPELARKVVDKATGLVDGIMREGVGEGELMWMPDPTAAAALMDYRTYRDFVMVPTSEIIMRWRRDFHVPVVYHVCGDILSIMPAIPAIGADVMSADQTIDLKEARAIVGQTISLMGNVHPYKTMRTGTPDDVQAEAFKCINEAGGDGRFILSPGCELPRDVPMRNIQALVMAAKAYTF